jgi:hypothetical protein
MRKTAIRRSRQRWAGKQERESENEAGKAHLTSPVSGTRRRVVKRLIPGRRFGGSACQVQSGFVGAPMCFVGTGTTTQSPLANGHADVTRA